MTARQVGVFVVGVAVYLWFLLTLSAEWLAFEVLLSLVLPSVLLFMVGVRFPSRRVQQLLVIESLFNVLAVTARTVSPDSWMVGLVGYGFLAFFAVQLLGFFAYQARLGKVHGMVQSFVGAVLILKWWSTSAGGPVVESGHVFLWGEACPTYVRVYYVLWALNALLVDSQRLPHVRVLLVHLVSIALALWHDAFFHVRLLTACHLFLLDLALGYGGAHPLGQGMLRMSDRSWQRFQSAQPRLAVVLTLGCLSTAVWGLCT